MKDSEAPKDKEEAPKDKEEAAEVVDYLEEVIELREVETQTAAQPFTQTQTEVHQTEVHEKDSTITRL